MPFTKVGKNKYKSPSGRTFTKKQVQMYYATGGFKKKGKKWDGSLILWIWFQIEIMLFQLEKNIIDIEDLLTSSERWEWDNEET